MAPYLRGAGGLGARWLGQTAVGELGTELGFPACDVCSHTR